MAVSVFGIRHHGPGSTRSLLSALQELKPDVLLVEGPPEAEPLLPLLAHEDMKPPVAMLLYAAEDAKLASYYPLAVFSPEWQAIQFAARKKIPIRFIDLPQAHHFAIREEIVERLKAESAAKPDFDNLETQEAQQAAPQDVHADPLTWLAKAAGFEDGENWWEHMVEHRQTAGDVFEAIRSAMSALRGELPPTGSEDDQPREKRREAYMRQCIRTAEKEFKTVAVVCGAWHVPALTDMPAPKEDAALLKGLPKVKVQATCIPWTHGRLSFSSGYGAGVESPGWYHHLWTTKDQPIIRWMTKVARLLRKEDIDASSAHVIEAVRLAEALSSLRERALPSLAELNEATHAIFCHGNSLPLQLIHKKLIVGEQMGSVPSDAPTVPLQQDVANQQKKARLKPHAESKLLDLDLRNETDRLRSRLLHRLRLLEVPWGERERNSSKAKGTFHEVWTIAWEPEFEIQLIERGAWGNTLELAASAFTKHLAGAANDLPSLTRLVEDVLLAELPDVTSHLIRRIQDQAAVSNDVLQLLAAVPALASVVRYGNVRGTDAEMVRGILNGIVTRACIGLPAACASLNDDAAAEMLKHINAFDSAIGVLQDGVLKESWIEALSKLAAQYGLHGLIAGRSVRLLLDNGAIDTEDVGRRVSLALSSAVDPALAASWCEGFLQGSGLLLVHDESLWRIIDEWLCSLTADHFTQQLAILRRTFATFEAPERRQLGERVAKGRAPAPTAASAADIDHDCARQCLPLVAELLGLKYGHEGGTDDDLSR